MADAQTIWMWINRCAKWYVRSHTHACVLFCLHLSLSIRFLNRYVLFQKRNIVLSPDDEISANGNKRKKSNICTACQGIFQDDMVERTVQEILHNSNLQTYECDTIYSSVSLPIISQIRELSIWIALLKRFPDAISQGNFGRLELPLCCTTS